MNTQNKNQKVQNFLEQMRVKCESKARQMAALEISVWDEQHEQQLKKRFGYSDKELQQRKIELTETIN